MIAAPGAGLGLLGVCVLLIVSGAGSGVTMTGTLASHVAAAALCSHTVCVLGSAVAVLVMVPPWKSPGTVTVIVKVASPPGARVSATETMSPVPDAVPQLEPDVAAQVHVAPVSGAGIGSLNAALAVTLDEVLVTSTV